MNNGLDLVATFVSADNEKQLQAKLFELQIQTKKMNNIISIFPRGSKIFAWLYVETKFLSLATQPPKEEKKLVDDVDKIEKKKAPRKKASKKVS